MAERTKIRSIANAWSRAEIATMMFGRIGKVLFFGPGRIERFGASMTPFVGGRVFIMLFEGVLVDENAVARCADDDGHGGGGRNSWMLC